MAGRGNGRLSPEARGFVVDKIRKDNAARAGSQSAHDKRISPDLSVEPAQLVDEILETTRLYKKRSRGGYMPNGPDIETLPDAAKIRRENLMGEVVENANIANVNANKINDGTLADARLSSNIAKKNDIITKAKDMGWGDGATYVPDGALKESYAKTATITSIKQNVKSHGNAIKTLKNKVKKLEQGGKKK